MQVPACLIMVGMVPFGASFLLAHVNQEYVCFVGADSRELWQIHVLSLHFQLLIFLKHDFFFHFFGGEGKTRWTSIRKTISLISCLILF